MDFDDQRDYMDQDIPAGKFLTAQSGLIAQFLSGMPDWMNMTPEDINLAVESLPVRRKDIFYLEYHCRRL
jgi:galactokinase/mevalonate kinase-like predicted kinase